MDRVQAGDHTAYRLLFDRYQRRIYTYLLRRTRSPQTAADLYQETFLKVHRARHTWQPGRRFSPWLFGIAANAARDHERWLARRLDPEPLQEWSALTEEHPDERLRIEAAIAALSPPLREAFLLGVVEGLDHRELAEHLGISPANARARVSRARARLRAILGE